MEDIFKDMIAKIPVSTASQQVASSSSIPDVFTNA